MPDAPDPRLHALKVPLFLGLGFALVATLAWRPLPTGIWHDDGVYLLIAKALANGDGLVYAGVVGTPPAAKFPPLYALVLTPFWMLGDDLAAGSGWVAALNVAFMALAAALMCRFLIHQVGWRPAAAALATVAAWSSPVLWRLTAIPLSEPLFILALCLAVVRFGPLIRTGGRGTDTAWFLAALAMAYLTRTAGLVLIAVSVVALLARRDLARGALVAAWGGLVVIPWTLWSGAATLRIAEPLRDILGSYGSWLGGQVAEAPGAYLAMAGANVLHLLAGLGDALVPLDLGPASWLLRAAVAAAVVVGVPAAYRSSPLLVLYPLGHLALLALWPYRSARLIAPVLPFVVVVGAVGVATFLRMGEAAARSPRSRTPRLVAAGVVCVAALLMAGHGAWAMATGRYLAPFEIRARTLVRAVGAVDGFAPSGAVLGAPELWAALHLHTGRTVAPSARFLPMAGAGLTGGTPEQQIELWRTAGIDHLLVEHGGKVHGPALDRMEAACPPGTVRVLASFPGPGYLVRLDLNARCEDPKGTPSSPHRETLGK